MSDKCTSPKKHVVKEGSREHVLWWDSEGCHCSEPDCEVNKRNASLPEKVERLERLAEDVRGSLEGGEFDKYSGFHNSYSVDVFKLDALLDALLEGEDA